MRTSAGKVQNAKLHVPARLVFALDVVRMRAKLRVRLLKERQIRALQSG